MWIFREYLCRIRSPSGLDHFPIPILGPAGGFLHKEVSMEIKLKPIGIIHSPLREPKEAPCQACRSEAKIGWLEGKV